MLAIEDAGKKLINKTTLTFQDLEEFVTKAKQHWWFASFWEFPKKDGQISLSHRFRELEPRNEKQVIEELLHQIKQIELVSIVLRFVRPDDYGILSPPVERILNVNWGNDAVETYCNYLGDLRAVRREVRFSRVADADMALWVLHAKCFAKEQGDHEVRGGPGWLDRMSSSLSGASRCSAYAAVRRAGRLSKYTSFGVCPSSARCGLVWL